MNDPIQTIPIFGFDPSGEPEIRIMRDGSISVVFNFMPPLFAENEPALSDRFEDFDKQMERILGVDVRWEDREVFLIAGPRPDTVEKVRNFLQGYRSQLGSV